MKFPLALCGILLAIPLGLGWQNQRSMASAEARHAKLASAAQLAGISLDRPAPTSARQKTKRDRPDQQVDVSKLIAGVQVFLKLEESESPSPEDEKPLMETMEQISRLSLEQLETVIRAIRTAADLNDQERSDIIVMLVKMTALEHPEYLLQSLATVPEIQENFIKEKVDLISVAFQPWLRKEPVAAGEWAKKNLDKLSSYNRLYVIRENAKQDPARALKLMGELQLENPIAGYAEILAQTPPGAGEPALTAARKSLAALPDEKSKDAAGRELFSDLANKLAGENYEAGRQWLEAAKLNPTEVEILGMNIARCTKLQNPSQWIDWIGSQLPADKATASIQSLVREWTQTDYQAAGKWLTATPNGPTKNAAVRAYAETVAKADPEVAKQWALTLPPGKDRENSLKRIEKANQEKDLLSPSTHSDPKKGQPVPSPQFASPF